MKIPGKLKEPDLPQLIELVKGKSVLMLGCYCGRALVTVAEHAWATWVLEDFRGYPGSLEGVAEELKANVERHSPSSDAEVNLLLGTPAGWSVPVGGRDVQPGMVDVVYRDADRREELREVDDNLACAFLQKHGGVYAWHDAGDDHKLKWLSLDAVPVEVN